ncbi:unnamed protein product [Phyllotreta striolata]|uniref:Dynein regulatory complex subunit 2 n=1 Tax=Phyllotreta striolata TaxID=444603 RepID=A0A9N9THW8_PHYSR|nr:unnamed protein product [Phyllotreta striolata]
MPKGKNAKKAAKKAAAMRQQFKDYFERERTYGLLSIARREKEWKKMLMKISVPHMREELDFAWISFERAMDNKDMEITLLLEELNRTEEQLNMNFKNHLDHIDEFIATFQATTNQLKTDFNNNITELEKSMDDNFGGIYEIWKEDEIYLKTVIYILGMVKKEQRETILADFYNKLEQLETKNAQKLQRIRSFLTDTHLALEAESEKLLSEYQQNLSKRRVYYENLKHQDDILKKNLEAQIQKLQEMYDTSKILKRKLFDCQSYLGRRVSDLENEWQFFNNAYTLLKRKLANDRQLDARKLQVLTVSFTETAQILEKIKHKGEHLLKLAAVCRKLETQEEKILPFPCENIGGFHKTINVEEEVYIKEMELFWGKVAQAEASRDALMEERNFLLKENKELKRELHNYCQCLNCPMPQTQFNAELNTNKTAPKSKSFNVTDGIKELRKFSMHGINLV